MPDTEIWLRERAGYLTASRAEDVCKRNKGDTLPASYEQAVSRVICERITGQIVPVYVNDAMRWGKEHEEDAAEAVESFFNVLLDGDGEIFIKHPNVKWLGASPDRFFGDDALVEIKCPDTLTHLERVRTHEIPAIYQRQMDVQLLCTGRRKCLFADYDPRLLNTDFEKAALWTAWYEPSKERLEETLSRCVSFLDDVANRINLFIKEI